MGENSGWALAYPSPHVALTLSKRALYWSNLKSSLYYYAMQVVRATMCDKWAH